MIIHKKSNLYNKKLGKTNIRISLLWIIFILYLHTRDHQVTAKLFKSCSVTSAFSLIARNYYSLKCFNSSFYAFFCPLQKVLVTISSALVIENSPFFESYQIFSFFFFSSSYSFLEWQHHLSLGFYYYHHQYFFYCSKNLNL